MKNGIVEKCELRRFVVVGSFIVIRFTSFITVTIDDSEANDLMTLENEKRMIVWLYEKKVMSLKTYDFRVIYNDRK